jgi:MAF protein
MRQEPDLQLARHESRAVAGVDPAGRNADSPGTGPRRLRLASGSPRRGELLALTGLTIEVRPASADETPRPGESGVAMTRRLAQTKAEATPGDGMIALAADTTVVDGAELLGKPTDANDARRMLAQLRGRAHTVVTSIAVRAPDGTVRVDTCESVVPMRPYTDAEIDGYLAGSDALDKAGAYAIQDDLFDPVDRQAFAGCFANVMGLPLCHLTRALREMGAEPAVDVPAACMAHLDYDCRVHSTILGDSA